MIVFDCDGVLVDTEYVSNRILAEMISEAGHPLTIEESIRLFKGGRIKSLPPEIERRFGLSLPSNWLDRFFERQFVALERETVPIPGIHDVLDALQAAGTVYCVASQASVAKMRVSLGRSDLWDRFEGRIYSADMVANPKPAPDLFLHAAACQGWPAGYCTVIEDSTTGVRAAVAAGMRVVGFSRDTDAVDLTRAGAHHIAPDMAAVQALIA